MFLLHSTQKRKNHGDMERLPKETRCREKLLRPRFPHYLGTCLQLRRPIGLHQRIPERCEGLRLWVNKLKNWGFSQFFNWYYLFWSKLTPDSLVFSKSHEVLGISKVSRNVSTPIQLKEKSWQMKLPKPRKPPLLPRRNARGVVKQRSLPPVWLWSQPGLPVVTRSARRKRLPPSTRWRAVCKNS